jgi:hypothetical protein
MEKEVDRTRMDRRRERLMGRKEESGEKEKTSGGRGLEMNHSYEKASR